MNPSGAEPERFYHGFVLGLMAELVAKGIPEGRIRKYGFAFCGKKVLIGSEG